MTFLALVTKPAGYDKDIYLFLECSEASDLKKLQLLAITIPSNQATAEARGR